MTFTHGPSSTAGSAAALPTSRYVLPDFEERTPYGYRRQNPYTKLFEDRIIFLGVQVDDASADDVMAQLLVLEAQDADRDITMYINSPGGSFTAMTAIYDTMQFIRPEVQTVCLGQAASAAAVLLAGGTPGKRLALPNARVLIHQPAMGGGERGTATDLQIQAFEEVQQHYADYFGSSTTQYGLIPDAITDPEDIRQLTSFFAWTAWAAAMPSWAA